MFFITNKYVKKSIFLFRMYHRLFLGNKTLQLNQVNSTNSFLKDYLSANSKEVEGLVVVAQNQISGRGQKGTVWESENGLNLTFSIFIKPNINVQHQFLISKIVSIGLVCFLEDLGLVDLKIKWPNDIYCKNKKIAGILIENTLKGAKVNHSIIGIGLNVNQTHFQAENNPTSIALETGDNQNNLEDLLDRLLFFIEKSYTELKMGKEAQINTSYLNKLYWLNEFRSFRKGDQLIEGTILGIDSIGKLKIEINSEVETFGLKEIAFFK
jgi:BirA family biotin operon repressor/biotin-[acetyl-CoA-carboxylase] ligase